MRTHQQIIDDAGGPSTMDRAAGAKSGTAKQWKRLNSIPAPYWAEIARQGLATLEELAAGAETRRPDRPSSEDAEAA